MFKSSNRRIALITLMVLGLDQLAKAIVLRFLGYAQERVVIPGFFKFVHWGNTGAAWSLFRGQNELLAGIALIALLVLYLSRHHFDTKTLVGQVSLGLVFGGIIGNLIDRIRIGHVIDFIRFFVSRGDSEIGFPAFNVADTAICIGVGLVLYNTWLAERPKDGKPTVQATKPVNADGPEKC